jgi:hypothetical protein
MRRGANCPGPKYSGALRQNIAKKDGRRRMRRTARCLAALCCPTTHQLSRSDAAGTIRQTTRGAGLVLSLGIVRLSNAERGKLPQSAQKHLRAWLAASCLACQSRGGHADETNCFDVNYNKCSSPNDCKRRRSAAIGSAAGSTTGFQASRTTNCTARTAAGRFSLAPTQRKIETDSKLLCGNLIPRLVFRLRCYRASAARVRCVSPLRVPYSNAGRSTPSAFPP